VPPKKRNIGVRNLAQYLEAIRKLRPSESHWWFRGQTSTFSGSLRPLLYRKQYEAFSDAAYEEDYLRAEFTRLGIQVSGTARDHWEWYFLMQHFGVPTRLLDWTDNALAALHFSVSMETEQARSPIVLALDPTRLNEVVFKKTIRSGTKPSGVVSPDWTVAENWLLRDHFRKLIRVKLPVAINPPHISTRLAAQGSRFILFGRDFDGLMNLSGDIGLVQIEIDSKAAPKLRAELRNCGVTRFSLFPDLGGLGAELSDRWRSDALD
jgi:hypothetical protein